MDLAAVGKVPRCARDDSFVVVDNVRQLEASPYRDCDSAMVSTKRPKRLKEHEHQGRAAGDGQVLALRPSPPEASMQLSPCDGETLPLPCPADILEASISPASRGDGGKVMPARMGRGSALANLVLAAVLVAALGSAAAMAGPYEDAVAS